MGLGVGVVEGIWRRVVVVEGFCIRRVGTV